MSQQYENYFASHYHTDFDEDDVKHHFRLMNPLLTSTFQRQRVSADEPILEIGSGLGGVLMWLERKGFTNVHSLELDNQASLWLRHRFPKVNVHNMSIDEFAMDGAAQKFKTIIAFEVIEHFTDPLNSLTKVRSIISENGFFVGSTPHPFRRNVVNDPTHRFVLHPRGWERLFRISGFTEFESWPVTLVPFFHKYLPATYLRIRNPICSVSTELFMAQQ